MQLLHVTTRSAAESIQRDGFDPRIGPRSADLGEKCPVTFFFTSAEALNDAVWLAEEFEDEPEQMCVIVVDADPAITVVTPGFECEASVRVPVPAAAIVRVYDWDTGEVIFERP